MTLLSLRPRPRVRDRRPRQFVPMVDGLDKRIAPGGLLPPPPMPPGTCDPSTPTT